MYGDEKAGANRKAVVEQSPISELDAAEWRMELDGKFRRGMHEKEGGKARGTLERGRGKRLPTPVKESEGEKS